MMLPLMLAALWAQASDPAAEGLKALEQDKFAEAAAAFEKVVAADPKSVAGFFNLGFAYSMLEKDEPAIRAYQQALALEKDLPEARLNLGIVLLRNKRAAEAMSELKAALPKKPAAKPYLAEALLQTGQPAEAEALYRELDPKTAVAQAGLARALTAQGKIADAVTAYQRAAELDPSYRDAIVELGSSLEASGRKKEAIDVYAKATPTVAIVERLGILRLETGDLPGAIGALEAVVKQSPTAANRFALATALLRNSEPAKAVPVLEGAVAAEPKNLDLRMMLGRLLRDQKQFIPAARQFAEAAQLAPDKLEAWKELSAMLIQTKNYAAAIQALDRVEKLGDTSAAIDFFRALVYDQQQMYKEALPAYQRFLERAGGKFPDEEFKARQRVKVIQKELNRR